jgi:hypothetical protein
VQKYLNTCFAAESKDMKVVICEENVWINASRRLGGIGSGERTKEEIYRFACFLLCFSFCGCLSMSISAIQELPIVLGQISEDLVVLTGGWHYTIIMEGPDPMSQGDIMTLRYVYGQ